MPARNGNDEKLVAEGEAASTPPPSVDRRVHQFQNLSCGEPLDALVIGGGITGAPLYRELCRAGFRTAIVDKGDFSSGTSQASGMLIWGGLLYLKSLDFRTVRKLCKARNGLLEEFPQAISRLNLRFLTENRRGSGVPPLVMLAGLYLYWLLGDCALARPTFSRRERIAALGYEEGMLRESDSRFVIDQITPYNSEHRLPLNYCSVIGAEFAPQEKLWRVALRDEQSGSTHEVRSRVLLNCGGVWTDQINRLLGVQSPCKHVFSKGVYIALPRGGDAECGGRGESATIYPMPGQDDVLTHVPWGPVMMWGPTETAVDELEPALSPNREDLRFLLSTATQCLKRSVVPQEIVSVRCGVRPLVVPVGYSSKAYPLELSRRHEVVASHEQQTIAVYGGKLTSSFLVASEVAEIVKKWLPPAQFSWLSGSSSSDLNPVRPPVETVLHPEFDREFVSPEWARDHEFCLTMDDYLRRRTPLAQWIPRMGLGRDESHRPFLRKLAATFATSTQSADAILTSYEAKIKEQYDPLFQL